MEQYLIPLLSRFQQSHGAQHAPSRLLQPWQKELHESAYTGTVLMDLSKAYGYVPHDLVFSKFEAYDFDNISLKLFHSYFSNRKQRVKIGSAISEWIDILTGIPQGSILGPLIFNIFINDLIMFIEKTDICNFADHNTLYKSSPSLSVVLNCLEHYITIVLNWFKVNSLKANPKKFRFMVLGGKKRFHSSAKLRTPIFFPKIK